MVLQGLRRLLESYLTVKESKSRMWFVHWLLGTGFYIAVGVGVWVEGAGIVDIKSMVPFPRGLTDFLPPQKHC